ncbi:MAG TPA: M42 family metallopeptidase [Clostridia bacterium]|nr:M42 family metallopeptidase [Clostridia bacterium]
MQNYLEHIVNYIISLCKIPSPSGNAGKAIQYVGQELDKLGVPYRISNKGGLIAELKGANSGKSRTVSAHVDTLGAMVKGIKDNGRLSFVRVGGYALSTVECENCIIETMEGKVYTGTVYYKSPSVHVDPDMKKEERLPENMEIVIDEVVSTKEEVQKLGIEIGDYISFDARSLVTESGFVKSRHLDDKACVGVILGVIKYFKENNITPYYDTYIYISNFEEVGHGSASSIPENTFEFLVVDMGAPGPGQNSSEYSVSICASDSGGPHNYELRKKLVRLAREKGIDYKLDIYPSYVSDGTVMLKAGNDSRVGIIGPGVYASHSYERTHKKGLLNTAELLKEYLQNE